ncbi:MAG: AcrR family transcriptional regulator [Halieaceae bacterium]|jgi:AcrR family transcriptional regulator
MLDARPTSPGWPEDTALAAFENALAFDRSCVYERFFIANRQRIKVQKQDIAVPKLRTILESTFRICEDRGFHAMSLRDLCEDTRLSMGGMYNYIRGKEELSSMISDFVGGFFVESTEALLPPREHIVARVEYGIRAYIYMTELFRPWYFFVFMETKNFPEEQIRRAKEMERRFLSETQALIDRGIVAGIYLSDDSYLSASAILSLIQDWHVKAWQFRGRSINAEGYADFVIAMSQRMLSFTPAPEANQAA